MEIDEQKEAKFGIGCLPADSKILTVVGWKPIKSLTYNDMIYSYNKKNGLYEISKCKPHQPYKNPYDYDIKVTLKNGLEIISTPNHKWLVKKNNKLKYIAAKDLTVKELPLIYTNSNGNTSCSKPLARILGYLVGDGHISKKHYPNKWGSHNRVQLTNNDNQLRIEYIEDMQKEFKKNLNWILSENKHVVENYIGKTTQLYFHDKTICNKLIELGIPRESKSSIIEIPTIIMQGTKTAKKEFLKALFSCDATISRKGWKKQNYHIALSTVSKNLATDVMLMLMELGYTPYMNNFKPSKMKDGYKRHKRYWISLFRRDEIIKFKKDIGFVGIKQKKLIKICSDLLSRKENTNNWNNENGINPLAIKRISRIKPSPIVYDIETKDNHNYICKGAVLHNSFREEMSIQDIQNILAKKCISTIWIYPTDFISRNSVYGFETYGKDLKNKLIRLIVYDLRKSMFGMFTPLGYIIVPKIQDPAYQKIDEKKWSKYRKHNKKLGRADFDSELEEKYEMKKDEWLNREQKGEQGIIAKERFKLGAWLGQQKLFKDATNKKRQNVIAQNLFPQFTSAELVDIVEIARMGMDYSEIEKLAAKRHAADKPEEPAIEKKKAVGGKNVSRRKRKRN